MLSATSKVHELFAGIYTVVDDKKIRKLFTDILRDIIQNKIISGKTPLSDFFEPETVTTWMGYVIASYGDMDAREFYSTLLDIEKDFEVTPVQELLDDEEDSDDDYEEESEDEDSNEDSDEDSDDEETEDAEVAIANAVFEAQMRKEKWMQLMSPIAKEFGTKDFSSDTLLKVMWTSLVDGGALDTLYAMGKTLYCKSVNW